MFFAFHVLFSGILVHYLVLKSACLGVVLGYFRPDGGFSKIDSSQESTEEHPRYSSQQGSEEESDPKSFVYVIVHIKNPNVFGQWTSSTTPEIRQGARHKMFVFTPV